MAVMVRDPKMQKILNKIIGKPANMIKAKRYKKSSIILNDDNSQNR